MDRGVQEEDSSSPSDSLSLVEAERTGTAGERIKLRLSDGSSFFVSEEDLRDQGISPFELVPELQLCRAVIRGLRESSLRRQAREKALDLLARAPHSTYSLRLKLLKRGFDARIVEEVLNFLREKEYLDDRRFAESWLRSRTERRPEGRALLVSALLRKGIRREVAEDAVDDLFTPDMEWEHARRALSKLKRSGESDPDRLMRKLAARGFSYPLIRGVIEEHRDREP
jgi:regulatory protein